MSPRAAKVTTGAKQPYETRRTATTVTYSVIVQPGDPLPQGKFVSGYKLNQEYGGGAMCILYEVERGAA